MKVFGGMHGGYGSRYCKSTSQPEMAREQFVGGNSDDGTKQVAAEEVGGWASGLLTAPNSNTAEAPNEAMNSICPWLPEQIGSSGPPLKSQQSRLATTRKFPAIDPGGSGVLAFCENNSLTWFSLLRGILQMVR